MAVSSKSIVKIIPYKKRNAMVFVQSNHFCNRYKFTGLLLNRNSPVSYLRE